MKTTEILIAGFGGQGILFSGKFLAYKPYIEKAKPLFPEGNLCFLNHRQGHTIPAEVREKFYSFMKENLTGKISQR